MSSYHHGDLRRALLAAAVEAIEEGGAAAVSLRDLSRRSGVSHAAPQHHFGDKAGLLTALAVQGYELLTDALTQAGPDLLDVGVAYVRFAAEHRAYFEVMFAPTLYHADADEVVAARELAAKALRAGLQSVSVHKRQSEAASLAAWSIVHGFATLWLAGALPPRVGDDAAAAARPVIQLLFDRHQQ
jgi:AcrR family transcriptional regulator